MYEAIPSDGRLKVMGFYLEPPVEERPVSEPVSIDYFEVDDDSIDFSESCWIEWLKWHSLYYLTTENTHAIYNGPDLQVTAPLDLLPVELPRTVYIGIGEVTHVGYTLR